MKNLAVKFIVFLLTLAPCYGKGAEESPIEHQFITDPHQGHPIEYFMLKPEGTGPFPVIFLLHGYQALENSPGGKQLVDFHYLEPFVKEGIVAVAISIPGHGRSGGVRDFSGPSSQKAVAALIDHFATLSFIDSKRMGVYGISKGAILASMVHKYTESLSLQILESGSYDLFARKRELPAYLKGILQNMSREAGDSDEALRERSAIYNTDYIHSKTLILVGEFDDRRTLPSSLALHEKLISEGKESQLKIFLNELHDLPREKWSTIIPFVRQHFFDLYGIGINVTSIRPAICVTKIHPDSPASLSGKLRIGDVILRISPQNDETEIDALHMPTHQFIPLMLGKKGTSVRLHVQHFDQTYEEIVIERG